MYWGRQWQCQDWMKLFHNPGLAAWELNISDDQRGSRDLQQCHCSVWSHRPSLDFHSNFNLAAATSTATLSSSKWKRRNTSLFWGVQIQWCPLKFKPEYQNQNKIHIKWGHSSNLMENLSKQEVAGSEQQGSWRAPQHSPAQSAGQGHLSWTRCAREGAETTLQSTKHTKKSRESFRQG